MTIEFSETSKILKRLMVSAMVASTLHEQRKERQIERPRFLSSKLLVP